MITMNGGDELWACVSPCQRAKSAALCCDAQEQEEGAVLPARPELNPSVSLVMTDEGLWEICLISKKSQ